MTAGGTSRTSTVLHRLDWQLSEAGRREHRFAWLRDVDTGEWLAVSAYYPANRVIAVVTASPAQAAHCREAVAAHDCHLLLIDPVELDGDPSEVAAAARRRLLAAGWQPRGEAGPRAEPPPVLPVAPPIPLPPRRTAVPVPAPPPAEPDWRDLTFADGVGPAGGRPAARRPAGPRAVGDTAAGITLVVVVLVELLLGGVVVGLGAGQPVLGLGFVLDAGARVLGTVAASQAGDADLAWSAVLFGSLTLWGLEDPDPVEGRAGRGGAGAAPAARLTAAAAGLAVVVGVLLAIV